MPRPSNCHKYWPSSAPVIVWLNSITLVTHRDAIAANRVKVRSMWPVRNSWFKTLRRMNRTGMICRPISTGNINGNIGLNSAWPISDLSHVPTMYSAQPSYVSPCGTEPGDTKPIRMLKNLSTTPFLNQNMNRKICTGMIWKFNLLSAFIVFVLVMSSMLSYPGVPGYLTFPLVYSD